MSAEWPPPGETDTLCTIVPLFVMVIVTSPAAACIAEGEILNSDRFTAIGAATAVVPAEVEFDDTTTTQIVAKRNEASETRMAMSGKGLRSPSPGLAGMCGGSSWVGSCCWVEHLPRRAGPEGSPVRIWWDLGPIVPIGQTAERDPRLPAR